MRNCTEAFLAEIQAANVVPVFFVILGFGDSEPSSGGSPLYICTGVGPITWNGQTWQGMGTLGSISAISEVNNITAQSITLTLNGIPNALISDALFFCNQSNPVTIYFGFMSVTNNVMPGTILGNPVMIFQGAMDVPTIAVGPETSSISISCENALLRLNMASNRTYTTDDQFMDFPGDYGFTFVASLQDWNGDWGTSGGNNPAASGGASATPAAAGSSGSTVNPAPPVPTGSAYTWNP